MGRPLLLIHGYSAEGLDFEPLCAALKANGIQAVDLNIANYAASFTADEFSALERGRL
jgi:hypothetical protein